MKTNIRKTALVWTIGSCVLLAASDPARAGSTGHYIPAVFDIRDYLLPPAGIYGGIYNYYYTSDRINNSNGDPINSVNLNPGPGPGVNVNVKPNVDLYALIPVGIWVAPWDVCGVRYGGYIAPSFANSSLDAELSTIRGEGINPSTSQFGVGDMFVEPLWLGMTLTNWDFSMAYGFYAPVGRYNVNTIFLPAVGPVKVTSPKNIGLGFWTHQMQGAAAWYPWADKRMAVMSALTYEVHTKRDDIDDHHGEDLTLNWGISQYLPLSKSHKLLLEIGPAGYDSWQITDDSGSAARNPTQHSQVHGVGGQIGLTYVPWNAALNFKGFHEFFSEEREQGQAFTLSFTIKF